MATIINARDLLLQQTTPRIVSVLSNFITVTATTNSFTTTAASTSPSNILIRANLSGELQGTVTWSTVPAVPFTFTGNNLTLPYTSVAQNSSVTVTATLTAYGQTYTSSTVISSITESVSSSLGVASVVIPTDSSGFGGNFSFTGSTMTIQIGSIDDSASWTYFWTVPSGVTATGINTRTISVTNMTVDTAVLTCTATRVGWPSQTKTFNVTKAKQGLVGTNGTRTAILDVYRWSASAPTTFPVGTSTYTWATGQFTAPANLNGWSLTPPTPVVGQTLWIARTVFADSGTSTTSSITWTANTALPAGASGVNGQRVGYLEVYRWAATAPTTYPSGTSTYTWTTGAFTAPSTANGWSLTPGASTPGWTLWAISVAVSDNLTTATSTATWNSTTVYAVGAAGTNGTNGATGLKSTSGYIYYTLSSGSNPGTPSASSFNLGTGAFTGLTTNWSTTVTMTGNGTYWAARYVVTESSAGSNTGVPSFSVPFTHQNFEGLVTFTNLNSYATQTYADNVAATAVNNAAPNYATNNLSNVTTIDGGKITTGSLSVDRIIAGTFATQESLTFGFGVGSSLSGIGTAGWFKSNTSSATGLAAYANYAPALAVVTSSTGSAAALFSNTYGAFDSVSAVKVVVGASIAHGASQAGIFTQRRSPNVAAASDTNPNSGTSAYARLAYLSGSDSYGARIMSTTSSGADARGITVGGSIAAGTYGLTVLGGIAPFTGCHDGLLAKTAVVSPGDILVDTGVVIAKLGVGDTLTQVMVSSIANQKGSIGVYTGKITDIPHILKTPVTREVMETSGTVEIVEYELDPQFEQIVLTNDFVAINSVGEGQINVCGEAGTIELGDLIVASSIPGKGMRQSDDIVRSYTVAKARETVVFDSPGQVKQIACIYLCG